MDKNKQPIVFPLIKCAKHLQKQLGFSFGFDFTRWVAAVPENSYVRMRCVFKSEDITESEESLPPFLNNVISVSCADAPHPIVFNNTVMDVLKPYMYPKIDESNLEEMDRLRKLGIVGERLAEIVHHSELEYYEQKGVFGVYLAPEKILADIFNEEIMIIGVTGTNTDNLCFLVDFIEDDKIMKIDPKTHIRDLDVSEITKDMMGHFMVEDVINLDERYLKYKYFYYGKAKFHIMQQDLNKYGINIYLSPEAEQETPIKDLVSGRVHGILFREKCVTLEDLAKYTIEDLLRIRGCGRTTISEINKVLSQFNMKLKERKQF